MFYALNKDGLNRKCAMGERAVWGSTHNGIIWRVEVTLDGYGKLWCNDRYAGVYASSKDIQKRLLVSEIELAAKST